MLKSLPLIPPEALLDGSTDLNEKSDISNNPDDVLFAVSGFSACSKHRKKEC